MEALLGECVEEEGLVVKINFASPDKEPPPNEEVRVQEKVSRKPPRPPPLHTLEIPEDPEDPLFNSIMQAKKCFKYREKRKEEKRRKLKLIAENEKKIEMLKKTAEEDAKYEEELKRKIAEAAEKIKMMRAHIARRQQIEQQIGGNFVETGNGFTSSPPPQQMPESLEKLFPPLRTEDLYNLPVEEFPTFSGTWSKSN